LTTAIQEWQGWLNWCQANGVVVSGSVEDLAHYAGERLGIDSDRVIGEIPGVKGRVLLISKR
ncbi:MAG: hypothetical protein ACRDEA_23270, partial [Microcystaceae cyanobacterium]